MDITDPLEALRSFPSQEPPPEGDTLAASGLGRDAFLKIFLTQLENQDPSSPEDASDMSQELAVFSQLEQQVSMVEKLQSIGEKIDSLAEIFQAMAGGPELQPMSLLGRMVDMQASTLFNDATGSSPTRLRFDVSSADTPFVLVEALDELGRTLGMGVVAPPEDGGAALARGTYSVFFEDDEIRVEHPDGSVQSLSLTPFITEDDGRVILVDAGHPAAPALQPVRSGATHDFAIRAQGADGATAPVTTFVSSPVDGVRVVNGEQILSVGGTEVDPSAVVQIR